MLRCIKVRCTRDAMVVDLAPLSTASSRGESSMTKGADVAKFSSLTTPKAMRVKAKSKKKAVHVKVHNTLV